jgi:hypothetical protein
LKNIHPKDKGLSFNATLNQGKHHIIIGGAEKCCDGVTAWKFRVNGAAWNDFTTANLDNPVYNPSATEEEDDEWDDF